jgi:hypothetical protein
VTVVFPKTFPGIPIRSMESFLRHLQETSEISESSEAMDQTW